MNERRIHWSEYPDIMTSADLMELLGITKETFYNFLHMPGFPYIRAKGGRKYIFVKSALQEYLHNKALGA